MLINVFSEPVVEAAMIEDLHKKRMKQYKIENLYAIREMLIKPILSTSDLSLPEYNRRLMEILIDIDKELVELGIPDPADVSYIPERSRMLAR